MVPVSLFVDQFPFVAPILQSATGRSHSGTHWYTSPEGYGWWGGFAITHETDTLVQLHWPTHARGPTLLKLCHFPFVLR